MQVRWITKEGITRLDVKHTSTFFPRTCREVPFAHSIIHIYHVRTYAQVNRKYGEATQHEKQLFITYVLRSSSVCIHQIFVFLSFCVDVGFRMLSPSPSKD